MMNDNQIVSFYRLHPHLKFQCAAISAEGTQANCTVAILLAASSFIAKETVCWMQEIQRLTSMDMAGFCIR